MDKNELLTRQTVCRAGIFNLQVKKGLVKKWEINVKII
jgi:hypothetical protein